MILIHKAIILFTLLFSASIPTSAYSKQIIADLSKSNITITSGFHGVDLLLFGAVEGKPGDDILVVISGPPTDIAQRRKANRAGIWINVETNVWQEVPSLYTILTTSPINKIAKPETLFKLGIGAENMKLKLANRPELTKSGLVPKKLIAALKQNMNNLDLWSKDIGGVVVIKNVLFRAEVHLPANILSGAYDVRVLQFRDGIAISEDNTNLLIGKGGLSAKIYNFAHEHSALYGIFAILFAVASGWLAATAFRRA